MTHSAARNTLSPHTFKVCGFFYSCNEHPKRSMACMAFLFERYQQLASCRYCQKARQKAHETAL
jgi:rubredoxin